MSSTNELTTQSRVQQTLIWSLLLALFALLATISAQPAIFSGVQPFAYIYLMFLYVLIMLSTNGIPSLVLFLIGILIDVLHVQILGTSSLIFLLTMPLIQFLSSSNVRFSPWKIFLLFAVFLGCYQLVQSFIQLWVLGLVWQAETLLINMGFALILFPILYGISMLVVRKVSRSGLTLI